MPDIPHLVWPLRLAASGQLADVEQDSLDDVRQAVRVLRSTPLGVRPLAPDIGLEDPTFASRVDPDLLTAVLEEQEDRARLTITAADIDETGEQIVTVHVALAADPEPDDEELEP